MTAHGLISEPVATSPDHARRARLLSFQGIMALARAERFAPHPILQG